MLPSLKLMCCILSVVCVSRITENGMSSWKNSNLMPKRRVVSIEILKWKHFFPREKFFLEKTMLYKTRKVIRQIPTFEWHNTACSYLKIGVKRQSFVSNVIVYRLRIRGLDVFAQILLICSFIKHTRLSLFMWEMSVWSKWPVRSPS